MPRNSERSQLIQALEQCISFQSMLELDNDEDFFDCSILLYVAITSERYLTIRNPVPRAPDRLEWLLHSLDDRRFKQEARMSRNFFCQLVASIDGHIVFRKKYRNSQRPIEHQLLVALKGFGTYGNASSIGSIARSFGISGIQSSESCVISL